MINPDLMNFSFDGISHIRGDYQLSGSQFCDTSTASQAQDILKRSLMQHAYGDAQSAFRELYAALCMLQSMGQPVTEIAPVKAAMEKLCSSIAMK
jgi:hypothetical protein